MADCRGYVLHDIPKPLQDQAVISRELSREHAGRDEVLIARWGKRQQLRRNFGLFSIIALTVTLMETWEGMLGNFQAGFLNGGPSGLVYGLLVTCVGVLSQVLVTAEMGSMIPLAGGQYNWVALLAPPWCSKFLSYVTGWFTVIGWQAGAVTTFYITGAYIQGLLIQCYPSYTSYPYQSVLVSYASIIFVTFINSVLARHLPRIESFVFCIHVFGFLVILVVLTYFAPHASTRDVFANFQNQGAWQTDALSFFIGLTTSMVAFIGIDGACHMAEEINDATRMIPRSMIGSAVINGVLAFAILVAVLFCLGDPNAALNTETSFPIIEIFSQAVDSNAGTAGLVSILIITNIFSSVGLMAGASRMLWAFAREKGLPGHSFLSRVEPRTKLPLFSIGLTALISALLILIDLGSSVVLEAFLSLTTAGVYSAYLISACVMLRKRLVDDSKIPWGPFHLGKAGVPFTIFMIVYSAQGIFFSFWPVYKEVTPGTMNWSVAVFGGVILVSLVFWLAYGRRVYKGPIVEVHVCCRSSSHR